MINLALEPVLEATNTTVTVVAGKVLKYFNGHNLSEYTGGQTLSIPTHEAVKLKSQGIVTY